CSPARSRTRETGAVARRWILTVVVAAVLAAGAIAAARAIRDDDAPSPARDLRASTRTTSTTAAPTSTAGPVTTAAPVTTTTSVAPTTVAPPGPCGTDAGPIRATIDAAVADAQADADVASCRLAASDATWAAV